MNENNVVSVRQKDEIDDPLTEILRSGAKRLIEQAVEAEFAAFLGSHATPEGKKELLGLRTGMRESAQSWKELLVDLKARHDRIHRRFGISSVCSIGGARHGVAGCPGGAPAISHCQDMNVTC
jgi:hypothetical protein